MGFWIRGKIPAESSNPLNRFLIRIYHPLLLKVLHWPKTTLLVAVLSILTVIYPLNKVGGEFLPQINEGDAVLLEIEQEVSSVADSASSTSSDLGATFNTRTVNNAVLVGSGETVVVGGLLDKSVSDTADKVPLLGDIPVIGALFRSTSKKVSKRNLMLFIRPTVIRDRDEYRQASSGQYTAFNDAQSKQRGKENNDAMLNQDLLEIYPRQDTAVFRQVSAAIDAFNLGGNL